MNTCNTNPFQDVIGAIGFGKSFGLLADDKE
jgi:hypothetical protein